MAGGGWAVPGGDLLGPQPPRSRREEEEEEEEPPPSPPPPPSSSEPEPGLEGWREPQESERHWGLRRRFLARNLAGEEASSSSFPRLLALSHVWANHLFLGCSKQSFF
ncbi:hypothetical protein JD844_004171 [Phrynosoma platyrhinos]|uniref:XRN2-binding (XTBD) domain-containing protein n=1 Tax=Phrynosoma platyrhinos TaxID=52577 RepID=A0ABQ7TNB4_PHRPL|nr:hypothetical protein JD844_004171 [Phrynosoma platyrhinos]